MRPFAVDANAIASFQSERISALPGEATQAILRIVDANCIALDRGGLCLQEWQNCAGGKVPFALTDWVADMAATGKIRVFDLSDTSCRKTLVQCGMPQDDHKWVRLAIGCNGRIIISGDVDFFDPTKKKAEAAVKERIWKAGKGALSKELKKKFDVEVVHTKYVCDYFDGN